MNRFQLPGCHLSPIKTNSVLEELSDKRLEVIQEVIRACVLEVLCLSESMRDERKKVVCHQHKGGDIMTEMKRKY